jgi:hypothetical protein
MPDEVRMQGATMITRKARRTDRRHRGRHDRGSALLVSLMVMVGLSLLGLGFVAISETENAISVNERNKTQVTSLSEAGAKAIVQWFQDPDTMKARGLLPDNSDDKLFKTERKVSAYTGYYRTGGALFDKPFGPEEEDMFFGDREHADFLIVRGRNDESDAYLKAFSDNLFFYPTDFDDEDKDLAGRVTAIRIYAPPIVGGALVNGFYVAGERFGIATIEVTAEKINPQGNVVAQSICRLVLSPFPLPGPSGAIQAIGGIDTNGAYEVFWGAVESEKTGELYIKRELTSLPWFNPYDRAHFEYGYDSSEEFKENTSYEGKLGFVVRPTDPDDAAQHEFTITKMTGDFKTAAEPAWNFADGVETVSGNVTFERRTPTAYPIKTGDFYGYSNHWWLSEMLERTVDDPWMHARSRGWTNGKIYDSGEGPPNNPLRYDYARAGMANAGNFTTLAADKSSHYFQYQTFDNRPLYKQVKVPRFDYDFWKAAALGARGQKGAYYLKWTGSGGNFTDGLSTKTLENWIKTGPGFYFFDTANSMNPQNDGPGTLVSYSADPCGAKGVVYMNVTEIKSTGGCGGTDGWYNQPGEPYRDIGYRVVNEVDSGVQKKGNFRTDAAGNFVSDKAYNNEWNFQDLPFSNGKTNEYNKIFDVCIGPRWIWRESDGKPYQKFLPLPYEPGCKVGNNTDLGSCECSEPHEPYLNIAYKGVNLGLQAYWTDPASAASVYPKKTVDEKATGSQVTCTAADVATEAGQEKCATNAYDKIGGLAKLTGLSAPGVEGVVYNEGAYNSTGNASYYGSVVVGGVVNPNGTQEVWYDACLAAGCWPPKRIPFPRVLVTSTQIE